MHPWKSSLTLSGSCGPCSLHPTSYFLLPTSDFLLLLPTPYIPHPNLIILRPLHPTSYFLLPTSYSLLPISCILLPTPYSLHPTPCILLPASYSLLPTPYFLLPTSHSLTSSGSCGSDCAGGACTLHPAPSARGPALVFRRAGCAMYPVPVSPAPPPCAVGGVGVVLRSVTPTSGSAPRCLIWMCTWIGDVRASIVRRVRLIHL